MKHIHHVKVILFTVIFVCQAVRVVFSAGETGAEFLKIGVGPRALSMGGAFTAVADDPSAVYWNPAGLTRLRQKEFLLSHDEHLLNIDYDYIGYVNPVSRNIAFGAELHYLHMNDIQSYDNNGIQGKKVSAYDSMLSLAYAHSIIKNDDMTVSAGASAKYIQQKLVDERAGTYSFDAGALYRFFHKQFALGVVLRNIPASRPKFSIESAPLPFEYRFGFSYARLMGSVGLLLSTDLVAPQDEITYSAWGLESTWWELFQIRAGFRSGRDEGSGMSLGAGTVIKGFAVDYAFIPFDDLGDTHKVSLGFKFGSVIKDTVFIGNEEKAAIHYERAIEFKQDGDAVAAAYQFDACLRFYPDYRDAQLLLDREVHYFYSRGVEAYEEDRYNEAIKWIKLALKYDPYHADAATILRLLENKTEE